MYDNYFKLRGVDESWYENYHLPTCISEILPADKSLPILDIGCGFGQKLQAIKKLGYSNLTGIDLSDAAIEHCTSANLAVSKSSVQEYKPNTRYQLVIMSHVLEHIDKPEVIATLKHIHDNLILPGGMFLVMVPNAQSNTGGYWAYEDFTHFTLYTSGSLKFVVGSAGFTDMLFLDPDGTKDLNWRGRFIRKTFLKYYRFKLNFWNTMTGSAYHAASPNLFTFEIRMLAKKN